MRPTPPAQRKEPWALGLVAAGALSAPASDALHVPLLVRYHQGSHAGAGALVALDVDWTLRRSGGAAVGAPGRLALELATCLAAGTAKEYLVDRHASQKEIAPWVWGGASALAAQWTLRW